MQNRINAHAMFRWALIGILGIVCWSGAPGGAQAQTYSASDGFSSTQGLNQWYYQEHRRTGENPPWDETQQLFNMTWDAANARWKGSYTYVLVGSTWGHPHSFESVRRWVAPGNGTIRITGTAQDAQANGGDGVKVRINKNNDELWNATIDNGNWTGVSFDQTTTVAAGDDIYFRVNQRGTADYDVTIFNPTITVLAPLTNTLTVTTTGSGGGVVRSAPVGIDCGLTCVANFNAGTNVQLTALVDPNSTFGGWSGDCSPSGLVAMTGNKSCTAAFTGPPVPISFCLTCLKIRLGRPLHVRGPVATELDNPLNEILIPGTTPTFRGFTAAGSSYKMDSASPWAMGGARTTVLNPGPAGSYDECGRWINDTEWSGSTVLGFLHTEKSCNYNILQSHWSFSLATSTNGGLSWVNRGQILTGLDQPRPGFITGEGGCTIINKGDGYYYAYCLRVSDWRTIVARAPVSNPYPGNWFKYLNGSWSGPGLGGNATALGDLGVNAGWWTTQNAVMLMEPTRWAVFQNGVWHGGLKASFSSDLVSFETVQEPLLVLDDANWVRPAPTDLIAYPSVVNYTDGNNTFSSDFLLFYTYIQPNEGFDKRYLAVRNVSVMLMNDPQSPQVGVALSRWYNPTLKDRWSTSAMIPGAFSSYQYEGDTGYVMTKPHPTLATVKLEECVSNWPGHPDHMLTNDGMCANAGYTRLRTAGWVFQSAQPNTVPLYRCYNPTEKHHFASNSSTCEGKGDMNWLLGYALAN